MNELRFILALICFLVGCYLIYDLFVSGFDVVVLLAAIGLMVVAHYIKPKRHNGDAASLIWDILDFVIDIPFRAISLVLRGLGRLGKGDIDGIDL